MSAVTSPPPKLLTAEEYAALPDDGRITELVKGVVVEMPRPETDHGYLMSNFSSALRDDVRPRDLGRVVSGDAGVVTERGPDTTRGPDVAYYSYERVPRGPRPRGYWPTPELVVEIVSPSERTSRVMTKVGEYLAAGVRVVLVAWPEETTIMAYSEEFFNRSYGAGEDLTLPELFPDFRVPVRSLFE
jgi:Uma2 family endonuclease